MFIFLLGSYDPDTKKLLYELQLSISKKFTGIGVYPVIMESPTLYTVSNGEYILTEEENDNITLYIFWLDDKGYHVIYNIDTVKSTGDKEYDIITYMINEYGTNDVTIKEMPITGFPGDTNLFIFIINISELFIILRVREETRGGEYLELCALLNSHNYVETMNIPRIFLFKQKKITLTSMLNIFTFSNKLVMSEFCDEVDLKSNILEIIKMRLNRI